ncbi:MAG: GNAT family N-acetyltransferase [Candidatus Baltobacteraceae bacterium]
METIETSVSYRIATPDDLAACAALWLEMFEAVGKYQEADFAADWRERFVRYGTKRIPTGEYRYFVAEDSGEIVGCAGALVRDGYPFEISGVRNGYIFGVSVKPRMQKRGIATALTTSCVDFLKKIRVGRILLHASPFGRPIYEKMGFIPTNEMELPLKPRL